MCGIFGAKIDGLNENIVNLFGKSLNHRGPENFNVVKLENNYFFGHTRLRIVDVNTISDQPLYSPDGRYIVSFNGEIYNYRELQKRYELSRKLTGDTLVIAELLDKIGIEQTLTVAEGMISISIYDIKNKITFLYRDPVGKKPLYYFYDRSNFAFASEIRSFKKLNINLELSEDYLLDLIKVGHSWGKHTPYKNILRLRPGELVSISHNKIESKKISHIFKGFSEKKSLKLNEFENLFKNSVNKRTVDEVDSGLFLSGGIDSSLVAKYINKNVECFSFRTNQTYDETEIAKSTAKKFNLNLSVIDIQELDFESINKYIREMDEPNVDISYLLSLKLCETLPRNIKVIFNGEGADEIFGGYLRARVAYFLMSIAEMTGNIIPKILVNIGGLISEKFTRISSISNGNLEDIYIQLNNNLLNQTEIDKIRNKNNSSKGNKIFEKENFDNIDIEDFKKKDLIYLADFFIGLQGGLMPKVDLSTMRKSIEARSPFLDISIIKNFMSINPSKKLLTFRRKNILTTLAKKSISRYLGKGKKYGFTLSTDQIIKKNKIEIREKALNPSGIIFSIINHKKFIEFLNRIDQDRYNKIIYSFWVINNWYMANNLKI